MIVLFLPAKLRAKVKRRKPLWWLLNVVSWFALAFLLFVLLFYFFEKVSLIEALWQAWQTDTTVGYGNKPAETVLGRVSVMIVGTIGIAFLGLLISAAVDLKEDHANRSRLGMLKNPFKNGYVLFNFPGEDVLLTFIEEIRHIEPDVGVCVVDSVLTELPETTSILPHIHFIHGSMLDREIYEKSCIIDNRAVIVFAGKISSPARDGETERIASYVERFIGKGTTRVIYEILDPRRHEWIFEDVKGAGVYTYLASLLIAQECHDPGQAMLFTELLKNTSGPNPHTVSPTKLTIGWSWGDLVVYGVKSSANLETPANFLGLFHEGKPFPCPMSGTIIHPGDTLSVAAFQGFDWQKFEEEMAKCKALASSS